MVACTDSLAPFDSGGVENAMAWVIDDGIGPVHLILEISGFGKLDVRGSARLTSRVERVLVEEFWWKGFGERVLVDMLS